MRSILVIALCAGCNLYTGGGGGGGGGCPPGVSATNSLAEELRDPSTGLCKSFATGCESQCGPCNGADIPAWPQCHGACDGLAESACLANAQCHAAYGSGTSPTFSACWNLAPGSQQTTACSTLDADTCAAQHQCSSLMEIGTDVERFVGCIAPPVSPPTCADPGICYGTVTCAAQPPDCPTGTVAGIGNSCWTGYCIPTTKCPD